VIVDRRPSLVVVCVSLRSEQRSLCAIMTSIEIVNNGNAFLLALTKEIDASLVKEWLRRYPNVIHAKNKERQNVLCHTHDVEVVKVLLSVKETLLDKKDRDGDLPIHYFSRKGFVDIVELILSMRPKQIHLKGDCGQTPLLAAMSSDSFATVQLLYKLSLIHI